MKPSNPVQSMTVYASGSTYRDGPSPAQQAAGMVPLDTLPADWWNWLWEQITTQINNTVAGLGSVYDEILSVLADAEIPASELQVNQLLTAIKAIVQRPGTSGIAGSVKSSTDSGKVAIDADGYMSPNGMGVPTSLNTTAKSIVSAVNEVLATLNAYKTSNDGNITDLQNSKAPNNHASADTTYGAATTSTYGHVKLSDEYEEEQEGTGIAASQAAVAAAYAVLKAAIEGVGGLPATKPSDPLVFIQNPILDPETLQPIAPSAAMVGTVHLETGFYYVEICGGKGGLGGNGGSGASGASGGAGGAGGAGYRGTDPLGFGEKGSTLMYLLAGDYKYVLGGRGGNGGNGGNANAQTPGTGGTGGAMGLGYGQSSDLPGWIGARIGRQQAGNGSSGHAGGYVSSSRRGGGGGGGGGAGGDGGNSAFLNDDGTPILIVAGGAGGFGGGGGGGGGGNTDSISGVTLNGGAGGAGGRYTSPLHLYPGFGTAQQGTAGRAGGATGGSGGGVADTSATWQYADVYSVQFFGMHRGPRTTSEYAYLKIWKLI